MHIQIHTHMHTYAGVHLCTRAQVHTHMPASFCLSSPCGWVLSPFWALGLGSTSPTAIPSAVKAATKCLQPETAHFEIERWWWCFRKVITQGWVQVSKVTVGNEGKEGHGEEILSFSLLSTHSLSSGASRQAANHGCHLSGPFPSSLPEVQLFKTLSGWPALEHRPNSLLFLTVRTDHVSLAPSSLLQFLLEGTFVSSWLLAYCTENTGPCPWSSRSYWPGACAGQAFVSKAVYLV